MDKIVYNLKEVSEQLGISVRTIREYIKRGELKASKLGRTYLVTPKNIEDFIELKTVQKEISGIHKVSWFSKR